MFMKWGCTCVGVFFNSDVEGVWLYFLFKNYGIFSKLNDESSKFFGIYLDLLLGSWLENMFQYCYFSLVWFLCLMAYQLFLGYLMPKPFS